MTRAHFKDLSPTIHHLTSAPRVGTFTQKDLLVVSFYLANQIHELNKHGSVKS